MSVGKNVFIVGPGFSGWHVLELLVNEGYKVTGLVRRKEHADGIEASGATAILGDLDDKALITEQTAKHDIVFHTATADHVPSAEAILDGVRQRAGQGLMTIYLHQSGGSILDDNAHGAYKSDKIYKDTDRAAIDAVADDAPHRPTDVTIVNAQKELGEKAKIAIVMPPLIYGYNPKHKRFTAQIPQLTRFAVKHGYTGHLGKGISVTSAVHVMDLARAYMILLHAMEAASPAETLENPYYFCDGTGDDEPSWLDLANAVGEQLYKAGKIKDPTPRVIPESMFGDLFGDFTQAVFGFNGRSRGVRLRELGWKPVEKDWKASYVEDEFPNLLKQL